MVSDLLGWPLKGFRRSPAPKSPSSNRHSLQQVLLLCSGIVLMVLLSFFVE